MTPFVMDYLEKRGTLCRYPWLTLPATLGVLGLCLTFATPLACAFFKQKASIPFSHLEPELRVRMKINYKHVPFIFLFLVQIKQEISLSNPEICVLLPKIPLLIPYVIATASCLSSPLSCNNFSEERESIKVNHCSNLCTSIYELLVEIRQKKLSKRPFSI